MKKLNVYYRGQTVGSLFTDNTGISFQYSPSSPIRLSLSLPISDIVYKNKEIEPFFSGILPDGEIRERMARSVHVSSSSYFDLLMHYGREVAGAIEIIGEDETPSDESSYSYSKIDEEKLYNKISDMQNVALLSWGDNVRMSLAGAQDKVALYLKDDNFYLPMNGAPSNVILKVGISDFSINEFVTTRIAGLLGLDVPEEEIRFVRDKACLLTKRFDREEKDGTVHRLHQEDMCQASAVVPENKYEENGGPGISQMTSILALASSKPVNDLRKMAEAVVFNILFGNCDAHAKNFSLLYPRPDSSPFLAPFYDLTCTTIYPELSRNMAMRVGREKRIDRMTRLDIENSGVVGKKEMNMILDSMIERIPPTFRLAEEKLPSFTHPMLNRIKEDVLGRIGRFRQ